jgi:hypothetical protein
LSRGMLLFIHRSSMASYGAGQAKSLEILSALGRIPPLADNAFKHKGGGYLHESDFGWIE